MDKKKNFSVMIEKKKRKKELCGINKIEGSLFWDHNDIFHKIDAKL